MAKTLRINLYIDDCCVRNAVSLLEKAGFSVTDEQGRIMVLNKDEGLFFPCGKSYEEFLNADDRELFFRAFYTDGEVMNVSIGKTLDEESGFGCFTLWTDGYAKKVTGSQGEFFDYNRYYENIVNAMNKGKNVIQRVVFDEL